MTPAAFYAALVAALISCGLLGYTYAGYPLLVHLLGRLRPRLDLRWAIEPEVSFVIAAHNEEKSIAAKLDNTLGLDYPRDKLEIVVAADGCTDRTEEIVGRYAGRGVRLFAPHGRLGKTATANAVVPTTRGAILVFSDATGLYNREAVRRLVANFADPSVGAVTGRVVYSYDRGMAAQGFAAYQRFVVPQRQAESRFGSETSVSGSIHAIRRELFRAAPPELSYDMVHPLHVAQDGFRTVYEAGAISGETARERTADEFRGRVRLAVRAYSFVPYLVRGLGRCRAGFVFQVVSHKLLRWLSPPLLVVATASSVVLAFGGGAFWLPLALLLLLLSAASLGWLASRLSLSVRPLALPLFFLTINLAFLVGLAHYLLGERLAGWKTER